MRNIKLTVEYEGTNYNGWQYQKNGLSIQEVLERALGKITDQKVNLKGASRTDSGVHALGQVANFLTKSDVPMPAFREGLNSLLPDEIIVVDAEEVDLKFDAIKSAIKKTYRYCIHNGRYKSVITRKFSWNIKKPLYVDLMKEASMYLTGRKDFKSFQATNTDAKTSVRNMFSIDFQRGPKDLLFMDFTADGFLKYMVRNIVGTLVDVGLGKNSPQGVKEILDSMDRRKAGQTAPAWGLFLLNVYYSE